MQILGSPEPLGSGPGWAVQRDGGTPGAEFFFGSAAQRSGGEGTGEEGRGAGPGVW